MFVVPSWDEYLRQQSRRTVADAALDDRLRAFLQQGTEPDVARFLTAPKPHHHDPDKKLGVMVPAASVHVTGGGAGLLMGVAGYRLEGSEAHRGVGEQRVGE
jgi:hypothetical protein